VVASRFAGIRVVGGDAVVEVIAVWLQNDGEHSTDASRATNTDSLLVCLTGDEVARADLLHLSSHHIVAGDVRHVPIIPAEAPDPYLVRASIVRDLAFDATDGQRGA